MNKSRVTYPLWGSAILTAFSLLAATTTFAGPDKAPGKFEEKKAEKLAEIDKHIAKMQEHRSCVASAADHDAMKKCHEAMKAFHDEMRKEHDGKMGEKAHGSEHAHHD